MNVTINQIRQEMTTLVQAHEMVNSFFWGDFHRAYNEKGQFYPLVCSYLSDGAINANMTQMQLVVIVCDKTFKGFENLNDTESDTLTVARHLFNVIKQSPRWNALLRVNSATLSKFIENTRDEVAGVILTMNVDVKQSRSLCDLPLDNYDFEGQFVGNQCDPVLIVNSNQTFTFSAASGTIVELPDTPVLVTDQDGNPLANESLPSVTGGTIEVEITPTPCADATVQINGEQVATVASGGMVNIAVENESGTPIGSFDEDTGVWVVPNCEDGTVTVNRDAVLFADVPVASGGTASINVPSNCPLPTYFEMTIKTDNAGTSASNQIIMPFFGNTGVQIDRGDGIIQHYFVSGGISVNNSITLSYATAGVYTIKVFGQISRLNFNVGSDALKVLSVNYWGLTQYGAILQDFFRGTANLELIALDAPDLSAVTSMVNFFRNSGVNVNLAHWVLGSSLTTMDGILRSSGMSTANYTDTIVGWALKVGAPINVSAGSQNDMIFDTSRAVNIPEFPSITTAGQARTFITTPVASGGLGWTISGDTVI